jgi:hypothetical protein
LQNSQAHDVKADRPWRGPGDYDSGVELLVCNDVVVQNEILAKDWQRGQATKRRQRRLQEIKEENERVHPASLSGQRKPTNAAKRKL